MSFTVVSRVEERRVKHRRRLGIFDGSLGVTIT